MQGIRGSLVLVSHFARTAAIRLRHQLRSSGQVAHLSLRSPKQLGTPDFGQPRKRFDRRRGESIQRRQRLQQLHQLQGGRVHVHGPRILGWMPDAGPVSLFARQQLRGSRRQQVWPPNCKASMSSSGQRNSVGRPCSLRRCAKRELARVKPCGLTGRSTGAPTAGHQMVNKRRKNGRPRFNTRNSQG